MSSGVRRFGLGTALLAVAVYLYFYHFVGLETWGHGRETIFRMLAIAGVVLLAPAFTRLESKVGTNRIVGASAVLASLYIGVGLYEAMRAVIADPNRAHSAIDIARNVYEAGTHLLAGRNPYVERCQLGHVVVPGPNVTLEHGELRMYGLPYRYGFPYFPSMILAYLPFRRFAEELHAIRLGNGVYLAIGMLGVAWLARRSVVPGQRTLAVGLASLAYLGIQVIAPEHFDLAVTDISIAAVLVFGFVAASYRAPIATGVVLGVVQGFKLLPGPLVAMPAIATFETRRERLIAFGTYVLVSLAILVPAIVPNPSSFLSSTIAFYLTYHGEGDDTSLYWFLPGWAKTPFLAVGFLLAAFFATRGFVGRRRAIAEAATDAWLAYFLFTAFNRMTHLNYLWGVHTLGAVAIACAATGLRTHSTEARGRRSQAATAPLDRRDRDPA